MIDYDRNVFAPGFAAPILWGRRNGYSRAEIAYGLDLELCVVNAVLDSRRQHRSETVKAFPRPLQANFRRTLGRPAGVVADLVGGPP